MSRIFRKDGRTLVIALDHGSFAGAAPGWVDPAPTIEAVVKGGADAIMTTLGIAERYSNVMAGRSSLILSTPMVADMRETVEVALKLGADALKVFVAVGTADDSHAMTDLWNTSVACKARGLPLLAEMFPTKSEKTPNPTDEEVVSKFSRIGVEYGADFIKTFYTGSIESFRAVTEACPAPVIILGGAKTDTDRNILQVVHEAIQAGGCGGAIGRNVWQHKNPEAITKALVGVIHQKMNVDEALKLR
jgi:DhnA family fructose-bisphosphate aldolase class Ia